MSCALCGHSKDVHEEYDKDPAGKQYTVKFVATTVSIHSKNIPLLSLPEE